MFAAAYFYAWSHSFLSLFLKLRCIDDMQRNFKNRTWINMKKSCRYCGKLHEEGYICPHKPKNQGKKRIYDYDAYRNTQEWKRLREEIRERDLNLCQVCMRGLYPYGARQYNAIDISIHHIVPLKEDYRERNDKYNLITLCYTHHKMSDNGEIPAQELKEIARQQEEKAQSEKSS